MAFRLLRNTAISTASGMANTTVTAVKTTVLRNTSRKFSSAKMDLKLLSPTNWSTFMT